MSDERPPEIGRYRIVGELGRGGFGRVYRAFDPTVGRPVAIKILSQVTEDSRTRFRNEAVVAGNLGHRNIVTVYEYGTHGEFPFLAMEYLEGHDLHHLIAAGAPLSLLHKCNIMSDVAEGLKCAHQSGVVHRDMKPGNIMVLRDGSVKIMDFGIARLTGRPDATRLTQEGFLIGTLRYMAPEQLAGSESDALCDIFAYGVVFYELLAGRHPFEAGDAQNLMYRLSFEDPTPIRDLVPEAPEALAEVIGKLLQKDRSRRYQTLEEVQFDAEPIRMELRRQHIAGLLQRSQLAMQGGDLDGASSLVQEALALEPLNRAARTVREELKARRQQQSAKPRLKAMLQDGEDQLAQRRFTEAAAAFEKALEIDRGNTAIQGRIEQARALAAQARRASLLVAEARKELEEQNVTAAYRSISQALRHDPKNPEAAEFLKTIQAYVDGRQAEQRIEEVIRKAEGLLLIPDYEEAIQLLATAARNTESTKIREMLARVESERRAYQSKQKLRSGIARATDLLREERLEEAAACLQQLKAEFAEEREVTQLLAYVRNEQSIRDRARAISDAVREAQARAESRDYEGALAALDDALQKYPGESALMRVMNSTVAARDAWERRKAVESALTRVQSLRAKNQLDEAIQAVDAALKEFGHEPALSGLSEQLAGERRKQQQAQAIHKLCDQAETLLRQAKPEAALRIAEGAVAQFPGDSVLRDLLARAREQVREQEEARARDAVASAAASHAAAHEFAEALRILDQSLKKWPDHAPFQRQRSELLDAKKEWEQQKQRAEEIDRLARDAAALADSGSLEAAIALLERGVRQWPDARGLAERRDALVLAREERTRREAALRDIEALWGSAVAGGEDADYTGLLSKALHLAALHADDAAVQSAATAPIGLLSDLDRARKLLLDREFSQAREICARYLSQYPGHPGFSSLLRELDLAHRRATVREHQQKAAAEMDLHRRATILKDLLSKYPDEASAEEELRFTLNKLALAESIAERARSFEQSESWSEALEQWNSLLAIYDRYPGLDSNIRCARVALEESARAKEAKEPAAPQPPLTPPPPVRSRVRNRILVPSLLGAGAALSGGVWFTRAAHKTLPTPVTITTNVSGASVWFGSQSCMIPNCSFDIAPGTYTVRASAPGRQLSVQQITVSPGEKSLSLPIRLEPLPRILQVNTNFESGEIYLDGRLHGGLKDSHYTITGLAPGSHRIRVASSGAAFEAECRIPQDGPPEVVHMTPGKDVQAAAIATFGSTASIVFDAAISGLTLDGAAVAKTVPARSAVPLKDLRPGTHQIGAEGRSIVVDVDSNPTLNLVLSLDRNSGMLIVRANEDGAMVLLNNRPYRHVIEHGFLRIPLNVGDYSVRVEKEGFAASQSVPVTVKKGEEKLVSFSMNVLPALVEITGAVAGAHVRLDGQSLGEIDRAGAFRHAVPPGARTLELVMDDYSPVRLQVQFAPGKVLQLSRGQVAMSRVARPIESDPRQLEAQAWAQVASSSNPDDFDAFIRTRPGGPHTDQARTRASELRQAQAARIAEQARAKAAETDRQSAEAAAAQHAQEEKDAEQARLAEEGAIGRLLKDFEEAYNRKDLSALQAIWDALPTANYRGQFREAAALRFQLQLIGRPTVNGNSATAICTRSLNYQGRSGPPLSHTDKVRVTLFKEAGNWRIRTITAD